MAIGTDVKAPYYILGADGNYHKLLNENIVEQIEGVGRRPATAYETGDVVASSTNSKVLLLCTQAGTTAETDLNIASKNAGDVVTDGTVTWEVIDRRITFNNLPNKPTTIAGYGITDAGLPVGHEFFTTNPNIPAGCIPLLGGEYSRTAYADLWAWVQTQSGYLLEEATWQAKAAANGGNVPFYSKGDGSTTFRVPALLSAKCITGESLGVKGNGMTLGLTDGAVNFGVQRRNYTPSGYFVNPLQGQETKFGHQIGEAADLNTAITAENLTVGLVDDAQKTGIIVDLSNQVNGLWVVKAYGVVTNVGSTDVSNIASGLTELETRFSMLENSKVDKAGNAWVVETYRNGTEWYRVWSDGWLEQGGYFEKKRDIALAVTFLKPYADENYTFTYMVSRNDGSLPILTTKSTTGFSVTTDSWGYNMYWRTEGKGV